MAANPVPVPDPPPELGADATRADTLLESYRRLAGIFHDVLFEQSSEALLDRAADTLAELVPYDDLCIYESVEDRGELVPVLARGSWQEEVMASRVGHGEGITGWAVVHQSPVLVNAAHLDPRVALVPGTPREPEALISVPLVARGALKGALNIYRVGEDASFDEDEFEIARWFGDAAAVALDNVQVRARLEHLAHTDSLTGLYNHRYFHERLRAELNRIARAHDTMALLMLDIDDFKRVNDVCGHAEGDTLLELLADVLRSTVRSSDTACRLGGEEFAVILPSCVAEDALGLAARLQEAVAAAPADVDGVTLSMGVAVAPLHAMNARELIACAETAMMTAKAKGKDRVVVFDEKGGERPGPESGERDMRSIAHLKMLQSLVRKLNRLNDTKAVGEAIVDELRILVDYHNCSVYLLEGERLSPVAVRGQLETEPQPITLRLGEGLTGHVAKTGKPVLVANAKESGVCLHLASGDAGDESMASVPLRYGPRVVGAITISKLGIGQFDEDDLRLLEVLAGHASIALENARLYESLRREADNAKVWLDFADGISEAHSVEEIGDETVRTVARLMDVEWCSLWIEDAHAANFRCVASSGYEPASEDAAVLELRIGRAAAVLLIDGRKTPFLLDVDDQHRLFPEEAGRFGSHPAVIAPLHAGFGVRGWIGIRAPVGGLAHVTEERLRLLEGLAYRASVALQKSVLLQSEQESAEVASSLLEFSRLLAGCGSDQVRHQIVELAGRMLGSPRTWLWLERGRPGSFGIEAAWRDDGAAPLVPLGSVVEFGGTRRVLERGEPFVLQPGSVELVAAGEDPVAVAPVVLPSGRIGCIAAAAPNGFPEQKLRLLAGIANQASLALHTAH